MAAPKRSTSGSRRAGSRRAGSSRGGARKRTTRRSSRRTTAKRSSRSTAASGADKSLESFRDALEHSVTISRDRLQAVVDDAVKRGRMTRKDANELVNRLVRRGRKQSQDMVKDLEKLVSQARREVETRTGPARRRATRAAGAAGRAARDVADEPLARADRVRRRAGVGPDFPITAYDQLTAAQLKSRLTKLSKADLRKVRTYEKRNKARKGILSDIEKRLK